MLYHLLNLLNIQYLARLPQYVGLYAQGAGCVFLVCVSERCPTRCGNMYRKDIRNNKSVVGRVRETVQGREGGFQGMEETKGEHPRLFILATKLLPLSLPPPTPPTSVKGPSSTISALQRGTTTNSASLTSQGKHSCPSVFSCCPLIPASSSQHDKCVLGQTVCYGRGHLCV